MKILRDLVLVQAPVLWEQLLGQVPLPARVSLYCRQHKAERRQ
jgi:hypothetical protein